MEINEKTTVKDIKEFLQDYMDDEEIEYFFNLVGVKRFNDNHEVATLADQARLTHYNIKNQLKKYSK